MAETVWALIWVALAGATGGFLNAWVSDNRLLWPSRVEATPRIRIIRPGLAVNVGIGALASMTAARAFAGVASLTTLAAVGDLILGLAAAAAIGVLAARWITNETDKRLLRVAVSKACAAPAAHPDTAHAMELAPPYEVFRTASDLGPPFRTPVSARGELRAE